MNRSSQSINGVMGEPYLLRAQQPASAPVEARLGAITPCPGVVAVMPEIDAVLCPASSIDDSCVPLQEYISHIRPASGSKAPPTSTTFLCGRRQENGKSWEGGGGTRPQS
jgi:hypothetical protein